MITRQHKRATPVTIKAGDTVMVRLPESNAKLSSEGVGPRTVIRM